MSVTFTTLTGDKTVSESIHNWVNYAKTPVSVILTMAESLIYSRLRVREMRASAVITLPAGDFQVALPDGFLEATAMNDREGWEMIPHRHVEERGLLRRRVYTDDVLESGTPMAVAIFDEMFQFECKADEQRKYDLAFFKTPDALSDSNDTNFLTRRYPNLIYQACLALSAQFRKDADEMNAELTLLTSLCDAANAESDLGRPS